MTTVKKGSEIELTIDSLAFGAEGVGKVGEFVVFVRGGLPGQTVRARVTRKRKSHAQARILEVISPSPHQIAPRCSHFEDCGGCSLQNLQYDKQLSEKHRQVVDVLQRLGGFEKPEVLPPLPSPDIFFYRNKMEFTFGRKRWLSRAEIDSGEKVGGRDFALGLHVPGRYDRILQLQACYLQSEQSDRIRQVVYEFTSRSGLQPYSTEDHRGFWRFLVVREGKNTGECLVNLVTAEAGEPERAAVAALAEKLIAAVPEVTTVVHTINRLKAQVATGQEAHVLHGPGYIHDKLDEFTYRISAASFFQTNTRGAEVLYREVRAFAELTGSERVYDLYCGAGTIGIYLSPMAGRVVGIELIPEAIADAEINARLNQAENCTFLCGDLKDTLAQMAADEASLPAPDVVVLDPPRAGLHPQVVNQVVGLAPQRIVYVSCNPATFARDARMFADSGFELVKIRPVDMFPHTAHIELVTLFVKKAAA